MEIQFTQNYTVKEQISRAFNVGDTLTCNNSTAMHFINKGVAIEKPADDFAERVWPQKKLSKGYKIEVNPNLEEELKAALEKSSPASQPAPVLPKKTARKSKT